MTAKPASARFDYYATVPTFPASISVETVANCNARCPFCPLYGPEAEMTRPKGFMAGDLFEKIVGDIHPYRAKVRVIWLCFQGEPLMDPHFEQRMSQVKDAELADKVIILTNAEFLSEEKAEAIVRAGVGMIMPGFDGASKEVYEAHRVRCHYEKVFENLRQFVALRNRLKGTTRVAIQYVRTPHNEHEVEAAYRMWHEILTPGLDEFKDTTSKNWATPRIDRSGHCIENVSAARNELVPCPLLAETSVILTDGRIAVCNWDYNGDILPDSARNVRHVTLADAWNSEPLRKLRDKHARLDFTDLPRCQSCGMIRPPVTDISIAGSTRYGYVRQIEADATAGLKAARPRSAEAA